MQDKPVDDVRNGPRLLPILALLAVCLAFLVAFRGAVWSVSTDLGQHYALASRIAESGTVIKGDPSLGIMSIYPPASHMAAALLGKLLGSTFLGIHFLALGAIALLWVSVVLMLRGLPRPLALPTLAALLVLLVINGLGPRIDLHGQEIVENYFFAQLAGHGLVFAALLLSIRLERSHSLFWSVALLLAAMVLTASTHLLAAVEILGLIAGLLVTYVLVSGQSRFSAWQRILVAFPVLLASAALIVLHPQARAMSAIAANNGALDIRHIPYPAGFVTLSVLLLASSILIYGMWLRSRDRGEVTALKYLAVFGAVASCLCLLQFLLRLFGFGSDYAVKKYGFDLTTLFLIQASVAIGWLARRPMETKLAAAPAAAAFALNALAVVSLGAVLFWLTPGTKRLDVSDLVSLEQRLHAMAAEVLPRQGKSNVLIGLAEMPRMVDYMFSSGILRTREALAVPDLLVNGELGDPALYEYVVSSSSNRYYNPPECKAITRGDLSVVAADCVGRHLARLMECRAGFDLTLSGVVPSKQISGFSAPEVQERWTDGPLARFSCTSEGQVFKKLTLIAVPFVFGPVSRQRLGLRINGVEKGEIALTVPRLDDNPISVDISDIAAPTGYTLELRLPDAASPKAAGLNQDTRQLGVSIRAIRFE